MAETSLLEQLAVIREHARKYFERVFVETASSDRESADQWDSLSPDAKVEAAAVADRIAGLARLLGPAIQRSPLLTQADERAAGHAAKGMRAALRFRRFQHWDPSVLADEDVVLGVQPAGESTDVVLSPVHSEEFFEQWAEDLRGRLELMNPDPGGTLAVPVGAGKPIAAGYRPNTAFVMMWMDNRRPELDDVSNTVKRCFKAFGITAVRSDDIEHEEVITQRIIDEIKTAEFLFGDLTGERPSVYYEGGFAHALGRRVILYRKAGTGIHFDLAAYNCPEFVNLSDLEEKLMKRLEYVTGRPPVKTT